MLAASLALALSFLCGMAPSFAVSVAGTAQVAFAALALVIIAALFGYGAQPLRHQWLLPSMSYQLSVPPLAQTIGVALDGGIGRRHLAL